MEPIFLRHPADSVVTTGFAVLVPRAKFSCNEFRGADSHSKLLHSFQWCWNALLLKNRPHKDAPLIPIPRQYNPLHILVQYFYRPEGHFSLIFLGQKRIYASPPFKFTLPFKNFCTLKFRSFYSTEHVNYISSNWKENLFRVWHNYLLLIGVKCVTLHNSLLHV